MLRVLEVFLTCLFGTFASRLQIWMLAHTHTRVSYLAGLEEIKLYQAPSMNLIIVFAFFLPLFPASFSSLIFLFVPQVCVMVLKVWFW